MADQITKVSADRDQQAFHELFCEFAPRVKGLMMRYGADAETAEELAQETLLTVWRKANLFNADKGSVAAWVFTIARNLRIDRLRREVVWQEYNDEKMDIESEDTPPDEAVSSMQTAEIVRTAVAKLPEEQKQVLDLSYVEGLSHSEISQRLGLPIGTVKSRMRLAYQKVKGSIEDLK